jgi:hypothetical protein
MKYNSIITILVVCLLAALYFRLYMAPPNYITEEFVPSMYNPMVRKARLMCNKYSKEYPIIEKFIGKGF